MVANSNKALYYSRQIGCNLPDHGIFLDGAKTKKGSSKKWVSTNFWMLYKNCKIWLAKLKIYLKFERKWICRYQWSKYDFQWLRVKVWDILKRGSWGGGGGSPHPPPPSIKMAAVNVAWWCCRSRAWESLWPLLNFWTLWMVVSKTFPQTLKKWVEKKTWLTQFI